MEKKNTLAVKPAVDEHVKVEVQGYGCGNDCVEYVSKTSAACVVYTAKYTPMW